MCREPPLSVPVYASTTSAVRRPIPEIITNNPNAAHSPNVWGPGAAGEVAAVEGYADRRRAR